MSKNLVWLASYPKSGNTWVRMLLAAYTADKVEGFFDFELARRVTASDSLRRDFVRVVGRDDLKPGEIDGLRAVVQHQLAETVRPAALVKTHNARKRRGHPMSSSLGAIKKSHGGGGCRTSRGSCDARRRTWPAGPSCSRLVRRGDEVWADL